MRTEQDHEFLIALTEAKKDMQCAVKRFEEINEKLDMLIKIKYDLKDYDNYYRHCGAIMESIK